MTFEEEAAVLAEEGKSLIGIDVTSPGATGKLVDYFLRSKKFRASLDRAHYMVADVTLKLAEDITAMRLLRNKQ